MTAVHFDRDGSGLSPRCGHPGHLELTSEEAGVTCVMCLNLMAGTHGVGNRRADLKPCGTTAAYRRHLRHDGKPVRCRTCLQGLRRDSADRYARRPRDGEVLAA